MGRASVRLRLSALRTFYRHLLQQKAVVEQPVRGLRVPKEERRLPRFLSVPDMERLLQAPLEEHRRLHEKYRPDDNARDLAVAAARRRDPAADHAAQAIVIYDLQRPGAFGLPKNNGDMAMRPLEATK